MPRPARPVLGRAGFVLLGTLLLAGCRDSAPESRPPRLELAGDTIELSGGTALIEIRLGGSDGVATVMPARADANVGDVVRFVAADGRGYSVRFDVARIGGDAAAFLEGSSQVASPPLLTAGAAWVVSLEGAPPGEYPFFSASQGTAGVLVVR